MNELDRLVNACLLPGFTGRAPTRWVEQALADGLAGVTLYGHNVTDAEAIHRIATSIRGLRADALIALDEEGGDVTRLDYLTGSRYPGNLALGTVDDVELTGEVARAIAADLARASVNLNLAPSVDVNSDPRNPIIGVRSFGSDPHRVAAHSAAFVTGLQDGGIAASAKHFPGHGATTVDSHLALPVIDCDVDTFRRRELPPFVAAIEAGVRTIMTAHVVFPALDDRPATLSRRLLTGLLREELGFDGVIVTDALDMAGVRVEHGIDGAAVKALAAGADLLLLGAEDGERHCAEIRRAVRIAVDAGELSFARVEEAAARVHALQQWVVEAHRRQLSASGPAADQRERAGGGELGLDAARRAVRSGGTLPLTRPPYVVELRAEANLAVGDARWGLADALADLGAVAGSVAVEEAGPFLDDVLAKAGEAPLVLAVRDAYRQPWQREWLAAALAARPDAVLVALGMPDDRELSGGTWVLAHGAARVNALAAGERLLGG